MNISRIVAGCIVATLLISIGRADVLVTRDGMVLNGKIVKDKKPDFLILKNAHGEFTIKYAQIKTLSITDNPEADMRVLKGLGKNISNESVLRNYEAGTADFRRKKPVAKSVSDLDGYVISAHCSLVKVTGDLGSRLPYGLEGQLTARARALKVLYSDGLEGGLSYRHFSRDGRKLTGFALTVGPVWSLRLTDSAALDFSAYAGGGFYSVETSGTSLNSFKMSCGAYAGPMLNLYNSVVSFRVKIDYIVDSDAPLYGVGLALGAGVRI